MRTTTIVMNSGTRHATSEAAYAVVEKVNNARGDGKLIALERATIPTGQMFYLDPDEVESIKGEE